MLVRAIGYQRREPDFGYSIRQADMPGYKIEAGAPDQPHASSYSTAEEAMDAGNRLRIIGVGDPIITTCSGQNLTERQLAMRVMEDRFHSRQVKATTPRRLK